MKKVGIIGCGWLGYRIAKNISIQYDIFTTTSTHNKIDKLTSEGFKPTIVNFSNDTIINKPLQWEVASELDSIIITVPFSEKNSLTNRITNLTSFIGNFKGQIFYMSSTGVYPNIEKEFLEADVSPDLISGERMIRETYPQVNILRLAGLMGDERLLSNYKVTNLNLAVNHIHYLDICAIIKNMIDRKIESKLYNVVAPLHPTKAEVINAQNDIPYLEKDEAKGKKISSSKLILELNYIFKVPDPRNFHLQ